MMHQRDLTVEERAELDALNAAVDQALANRKAWLDAKMVETSRLKVGDEIYNLKTGDRLGVVTELYRYWANQNNLLDTGVHCDYRYLVRGDAAIRSYDNTSRQIGLRYGSKEDLIWQKQFELSSAMRK
jgi:hypothetical protein